MSQLAWRNPARMMDSASTVLPSGASSVVVDSVVVQNLDRILFTSLSDPLKNNRIYKPNNIGVSVNWVLERDGYDAVKQEAHGDPSDGEILYIREGTIHRDKIFAFRSESNTWDNILQGASDIVAIHRDNSQPPSTNISWNNFKLIDLANATLASDAVNKGQLDTAIASVSMAADPNAIRKNNTNPPITDISWAGFRLLNLGNGLVAGDAVNKSQLDLKADKTYVDSQNASQDITIASKADKTYVDSQNSAQDSTIALKADKTYVDSQNSLQDAEIALKAYKTYVDSQDALKADKTYVDSQNASQDATISLKADKTYVDFQNSAQDAQIALRLRTDGGNSPTAAINWGNQDLSNVKVLVIGNNTLFRNTLAINGNSVGEIEFSAPGTFSDFLQVEKNTHNWKFHTSGTRRFTINASSGGTIDIEQSDLRIFGAKDLHWIDETGNIGKPTNSRPNNVYIKSSLGVAVGAANNASAIIQADSTTQGFLPPRMTIAQRDAIGTPAAGLLIFNTTTSKLNVYSGTAWEAITSI